MTRRQVSFSARTAFEPNAEAAAAAPSGCLDLTETNPTRVGLAGPLRVAQAYLRADAARYDPDPRGACAAREHVAQSYAERGLVVDPAHIMLTASTSEAYGWLFKLLCDPGDGILIPTPSYPLFDCLARLESVATTTYPLMREERFRVDVDALRRAVSDRVRAIVIVAPNNPTGSLVHEDDAQAIDALASEHGLSLIVDEVFADYTRRDTSARLRRTFIGTTSSLCFVLSGLSKVVLAPQLKLGWIVASGQGATAALARLEIVADTYLSVSSPVQHALGHVLAERVSVQRELAERIDENLRTLQAIGVPSIRPLPVDGGWMALIEVPRIMSEDAWVAELAGAGVRVQPGWFYDIADGGTLVVSLIVEPATFREGIARLAQRVVART